MSADAEVVLATVTLTYGLAADGEATHWQVFDDGNDEWPDVTLLLGMLRLAEDTVLLKARGELPEAA